MKLNVSDLLKEKGLIKDIDVTIEKHEVTYDGESIKILEPIIFKGQIVVIEDLLNLQGKALVKLKLTCSRCLEEFEKSMELKVNENFTNVLQNEDDKIIFIDSDVIDITKIIENNIIMSLPMKRLCRKGCKGLCSKCGKNLNYSTCDCQDDDIDPRFAKLKDFFASN